MRQQNPESTFNSGYATTQDSAEQLSAISLAGAGELAAVTFTSHQNPADSPDDSSCTVWRITLYLLPQGASYQITTAPPGYRASYQSCQRLTSQQETPWWYRLPPGGSRRCAA
jgi:hypothetical protein